MLTEALPIKPTADDAVIGAVFTPLEWGRYFIRHFGLAKKWLAGKSVFDPTMGEGHLLEALIEEALAEGADVRKLPLHNLYGCELNRSFFNKAQKRIKDIYGLNLPRENFYCQDILTLSADKAFDIILANPPWGNFTDLPNFYKPLIKDEFLRYGLVADKRDLLWGGSRIDIAALVIQKTMAVHLRSGGEGYYFMPLSLLLNDGAHAGFRHYHAGGEDFCIKTLYDFGDEKIFANIETRYGFAAFVKGERQGFPIICRRRQAGQWERYYARPYKKNKGAALSLSRQKEEQALGSIRVSEASRPRQGVNSCGANDLYFFDSLTERTGGTAGTAIVANKAHEVCLPCRYLYPVMGAKNFAASDETARRWVFLPYDSGGHVLSAEAIQADTLLRAYLHKHEARLRARRGVMIGSLIKRDLWWGLLGVGPYSFAPYKVAWESYGRDSFKVRLFNSHWQANQSLQAFMPFNDRAEARRVAAELGEGWVERYLLSFGMAGTMGWAQPGRVKGVLELVKEINIDRKLKKS